MTETMRFQFEARQNRNIRQPNQWGVWNLVTNRWHSKLANEYFWTEKEAQDYAIGLTQTSVPEIDWSNVKRIASEHYARMVHGQGNNKTDMLQLALAVMEAIYGKEDIWEGKP